MSRKVNKYGGRTPVDIVDWVHRDGSRINVGDVVSDALTPFNTVHVSSETPILELKSIYGLSDLRDVQATAGSATITHTGPEFKLSTTASGSDSATLSSAERGRYVPGTNAIAGIGIRRPTAATGSQDFSWGLFDDDDGFYFGEDSTGVYIARLIGGSETKVYQPDWNVDTLDGSDSGSNPSGLSLSLSRGNVFRVKYTWYGYGTTAWEVLVPDNRERLVSVTVHRFNVDGGVSIDDPNLPVRAKIENGGTATTADLFVGGRQFSILGDYEPNQRRTHDRRLSLGSVGTSFLPTISFRRKSDIAGGAQFRSTSVKVGRVDIITDADLIWQLRTGASLTGASWGTPAEHTAAETSVEADTSATAISGGNILDGGLIVSGQGSARGSSSLDAIDFDFVDQDPVTLAVRQVSGTGGTVSALFGVSEEW